MENTSYQIIDHQTAKAVGGIYTYAQRNRARSRAEKMNQEYGAVRYSAQPNFAA
jgi:hypothetical protein